MSRSHPEFRPLVPTLPSLGGDAGRQGQAGGELAEVLVAGDDVPIVLGLDSQIQVERVVAYSPSPPDFV